MKKLTTWLVGIIFVCAMLLPTPASAKPSFWGPFFFWSIVSIGAEAVIHEAMAEDKQKENKSKPEEKVEKQPEEAAPSDKTPPPDVLTFKPKFNPIQVKPTEPVTKDREQKQPLVEDPDEYVLPDFYGATPNPSRR